MSFSEKHLVLWFIALFAVGVLFLFWQNKRELDPNLGKSWWTLSFATPEHQESLDFTIENYSNATTFHYEVVAEKKVLASETINLIRGEKKTIAPTIVLNSEIRTSIIVTAGTEKKEIYR
ncbi:MAG: hypothetical protein Q8O53_00975 [Candidatus Moranbacteria bacterium]|nr:hypothetical protein [Candidatus Moranbacteria bacterium]